MSVQIALHDPAFERARRDVVETHDQLSRRRVALSGQAEQLLGAGWRGPAAGQYADAWQEWERGAELVLRSLLDLATAMLAAHGGLTAADSSTAADAGRLRARLGGGG